MMTWPSAKSATRKCISRRNAKWLNVLRIWVSGTAAQATGSDDWTKWVKIFERFSYSFFILLLTLWWYCWLGINAVCGCWLDLRLRTTRRTDDWPETLQLLTNGFGWIDGTGAWHWSRFDWWCGYCCNLEYYDMKCILKSYINFFSFLNKIVIVLFYIVIIIVIMLLCIL